MAKYNGSVVGIMSGTDKILHSTSCTLTTNQNLFDTTTKDDAGWETHGNGMRGWTISGDGKYDTAGSGITPDEILAAIIGRTADTVIKFATDIPTAAAGWTGNGTFQDCNITAQMEDAVTFTFTIKGNGALAAI